jgi:hypothetical protein
MYKRVKIKKGSSFCCHRNELIFIDGYDMNLSCFIEENLYHLKALLEGQGATFQYLPDLTLRIINSKIPQYYAPQINTQICSHDCAVWISNKVKQELIGIDFSRVKGVLLGASDNGETYSCEIDGSNLDVLEKTILDFYEYCYYPRILCSEYGFIQLPCKKEPDDFADNNFEQSIAKISDEIRAKVAELRALGVSEFIIQSLFQEQQKLSRLLITSDYRIVLPDYNNMEIKMEPLPKAIYLLFLKHPEGIKFKDMPDHQKELFHLYRKVAVRGVREKHLATIADLVNPFNNSMNEKCSIIKKRILALLDDDLAQHYYISGGKGETKKIDIHPSMIEWEG